MNIFPGNRTGVRRRAGRVNKDVFIFAFFVLLAFIFWYLNSLHKVTEASIKFPVRYTNIPAGKSVIEKEPEKLNLFLRGTGSSILKLKLSVKKKPVAIDISRISYRRISGSKERDYYILTSHLLRSLAIQLRTDCEIMSIKPDTLFFTIERVNTGN